MSRFLAPGYFKLGLGMEYKKGTWLSLNFSPLTAGATVVTDEELRKKYGNEIDEEIRYQLGAQLNLVCRREIEVKSRFFPLKVGRSQETEPKSREIPLKLV